MINFYIIMKSILCYLEKEGGFIWTLFQKHHTEEGVVEQNISRKDGLKAERGEAPWPRYNL